MKPDYSDLEAGESIGHIFGFILPVLLIVGSVGLLVYGIGRLFF